MSTPTPSVSCYSQFSSYIERKSNFLVLAAYGVEITQQLLRTVEAIARIFKYSQAIHGVPNTTSSKITKAFDAAGSVISSIKIIFVLPSLLSLKIKRIGKGPDAKIDILKTVMDIALKVLTAIGYTTVSICYFAKLQLFKLKDHQKNVLFSLGLACASIGTSIHLVESVSDFFDAGEAEEDNAKRFTLKMKAACKAISAGLGGITLGWDFGFFYSEKFPAFSLIGAFLTLGSSVFEIGQNWVFFDPENLSESLGFSLNEL